MRLIDADALKAIMIEALTRIKDNPKMDGQERHILAAMSTLAEMINDMPTATPESKGSDIGVRVYSVLEKKGWTAPMLAEVSGLNYTTIYHIINSRTRPRPTTIKMLADALGVSEMWLITGREDEL